ncbi:hypothetical protein ETW23_21930 (plasmid) [Leisingera sp. NJS201]|uniref:hypothetical protein n=1 Tax=Leisingera sp. NJS201 TaxID=2508306 RepID=UPI0010713AC0|nr:hypothetical protein [Leisingera sp. NJS201]QBR38565.1 hypothetical protein ETW23_21930 [Leisingera sp. NJS201]
MSEWILADGHVHLYACADRDLFLEAAWRNLSAGARGLDAARWDACLFFTETARDNAFDTLCTAEAAALPAGWRLRRLPEDSAAAVLLREQDGAALTVIAGRQVISSEGIEVLALATVRRFCDGRPAAALLGELQAAGIPAVLPWGVGKWLGRRGRLVAELLQTQAAPGLFLGDNAGRPRAGQCHPCSGAGRRFFREPTRCPCRGQKRVSDVMVLPWRAHSARTGRPQIWQRGS